MGGELLGERQMQGSLPESPSFSARGGGAFSFCVLHASQGDHVTTKRTWHTLAAARCNQHWQVLAGGLIFDVFRRLKNAKTC